MTEHLNNGTHPDADQISTFLEGRATERERAQVVEHLSGCAICRDVVFLAGEDSGEAAVAAQPFVREPRRWWMQFGFAGAAVACALVAVALYVERPASPHQEQLSRVETPAVVAPAVAPPSAQPQMQTELKKRAVDAQPSATAKFEGRGTGAGLGAGVAGGPQNGQSAAGVVSTGRNLAELTPLAPKSDQKGIGADATSLFAPPAAPRAGAASPQNAPSQPGQEAAANDGVQSQGNSASATGGPMVNNQAANALVPLRIEHNGGPADGFSQLTGVVTDMSGAVIPRATVALASADGTSMKKVATGADGKFTVANVAPGHYELRVSAPGFTLSTEQLDLKPRDLAMVNSVLQVGSEAETVTVESAANEMQTAQAEVSAKVSRADRAMARKAAPESRVESGGRILRMDSAGLLYRSGDGGKSWKKIRGKWTGRVSQIGLAPAPANGTAGGQVFRIITDSGETWVSGDGAHWKRK